MRTISTYYFDYTSNEYLYLLKNDSLKNTEKQLLYDLVQGKTVRQLAVDYNCSERTICNRRKDLFLKTKALLSKININYGDDIKLPTINTNPYKCYSVYMLIFPNNKVYVGQTINTQARWSGKGIGYKNNEEMYNAIVEFGWENITKKVIFSDLTLEESLEKEKEMIIHYKSNIPIYGYNKSFN